MHFQDIKKLRQQKIDKKDKTQIVNNSKSYPITILINKFVD